MQAELFSGEALFLFLLLVVGVVAPIQHQFAVAQFDNAIGHSGDEVAVVGDHKYGPLVLHDGILQHLLGGDIKVVGGLIEHQQIAGGQQHQGQG